MCVGEGVWSRTERGRKGKPPKSTLLGRKKGKHGIPSKKNKGEGGREDTT